MATAALHDIQTTSFLVNRVRTAVQHDEKLQPVPGNPLADAAKALLEAMRAEPISPAILALAAQLQTRLDAQRDVVQHTPPRFSSEESPRGGEPTPD